MLITLNSYIVCGNYPQNGTQGGKTYEGRLWKFSSSFRSLLDTSKSGFGKILGLVQPSADYFDVFSQFRVVILFADTWLQNHTQTSKPTKEGCGYSSACSARPDALQSELGKILSQQPMSLGTVATILDHTVAWPFPRFHRCGIFSYFSYFKGFYLRKRRCKANNRNCLVCSSGHINRFHDFHVLHAYKLMSRKSEQNASWKSVGSEASWCQL